MSSSDEKSDKATDIAKNIWLAGLGAYGKAFDAASDVSKDADSFFENLVERGQELEQQAKDQISKAGVDTKKSKMAIEERIEKMRNYLGMPNVPSPQQEIERLQEKVKGLESKLKAVTSKFKSDKSE